jgi:hypothetical protein
MICNNKPVIGEIEMRAERRQRNIIYIKIMMKEENRSIQNFNDICVCVESTQISRHTPLTIEQIDFGNGPISLKKIVEFLLIN